MLIFLDLETTGLEAQDVICSIAILMQECFHYTLLNEGKKIPAEASSIHHITNEMIQDKSSFLESNIYTFLKKNNTKENTLVAHNVAFDIEKLSSAGLVWKGDVIDTLRVTKHLIPECEVFSLQFLRYELQLYKKEQALKDKYGIKDALVAHNALSDACVCKLLFETLLEYASEEKMKELSFKNVLLEKFSFGKYKGKYMEEVCMNDPQYARWVLTTLSDIDEDTKYSIHYYLEG